MEDSENFSETSPQVSTCTVSALETFETASILIKGNKSKDMTKSVSFSFLRDNETMESIKSNTESDLFNTYFNILSSNDEARKSNQSNNSSNIIPQNISDVSRRSNELEHTIESEKEPISNYLGWDGYEARFERSSDHDSRESVPQCIPPWAKTLRSKYGDSPTSSFSREYQSKDKLNAQDRIKHLMDKYSDLILVKREESKKQVIVEQGKYHDDIDTVKARAKHTRYYIAPLSKSNVKKPQEDDDDKLYYNNIIETSSLHSDNMSLTKKTSKTQAKREVHRVIQPVMKRFIDQEYGNTETKDQRKCQKLSLKNIREFVNAQSMTPDQRKLHEIIKIETVPSINQEMKDKVGSKYVINVPQNKPTDGATVNIIKIKEKRKLRFQSLEDVSEKTTELRYSEGTPQKQDKTTLNRLSHQGYKSKTIDKTVKSPTETKTFQVTSKTTPHITPFVEEENKTDKLLLIQYENKSPKHKSKDMKQSKYTTKLLGVRRPASSETGEMYMYEAETCGEKQRENTTKLESVHPNLKEKLNAIFDELRGLPAKKGMLPDSSSDVQVRPDHSDHRSEVLPVPIETDVVSVQAMPDMKSVEVQVRQSQIISPDSLIIAPHPSPISDYTPDILASTDEWLEKAAKDLVTYADTTSDTTDEKIIKKESFDDGEVNTQQFGEDEIMHEDKFLDSDKYDENRQSGQSLKKGDKDIYKGTEDEEMYDELAYIDQVEEDEDATDISPLVKSVTFDESKDIDELGIIPEVTDVGDKSGIIQDSTTDKVTLNVLSDLKELDDEDEVFGKKLSFLDPVKDKQTKADEVITKLSKESLTSTKLEKAEEYHKRIDTSTGDIADSHEDKSYLDVETVTDTVAFRIDDDIRSYNLDGYKDTELTFTSSSKFLHKRDSIRKRLNWSDDTLYLEKHLCPQLIRGLAETAVHRPTDPIAFLAHWIYKDYQNREKAEQEAVHQEHRQLERTMCDVHHPDALVHKKFNLKKYPVKKLPSIISEKAPTIDTFNESITQNEITQEA